MLLKSYRSFDAVAEFEPSSGKLHIFSRSKDADAMTRESISGIYDHIDGQVILLYRSGDDLILQIDGQRIDMNEIVIERSEYLSRCTLRFTLHGNELYLLNYLLPKMDPPLAQDPSAFVDVEDFDFGLFLFNVSCDQIRRERLFEKWH